MKLNIAKYFSSNLQTPRKKKAKQNKRGIIYPDDASYALKKRMIIPKWWVESILFTLGKKSPWYNAFIADHFKKNTFEYFKVKSTNMFFMIFLWNAVVRKIFDVPHKKLQSIDSVKIDISKFLIGTEKQNAKILDELEENLIKPIKVLNVVQVKKTAEANYEKKGFVNIFRKVSLLKTEENIWLNLHFAQNPMHLFASPDVKPKKSAFKNSFISVNPTFFYAMGSRVKLSQALNGLFLEYNKQHEGKSSVHTSFNLQSENCISFLKQVSTTAEDLYDQAILDNQHNPPSIKISQILKRQKVEADEENSMVFSWGLSSQTKVARQFEVSLAHQLKERVEKQNEEKLFTIPAKDELKIAKLSKKVAGIKKPLTSYTQVAQAYKDYIPASNMSTRERLEAKALSQMASRTTTPQKPILADIPIRIQSPLANLSQVKIHPKLGIKEPSFTTAATLAAETTQNAAAMVKKEIRSSPLTVSAPAPIQQPISSASHSVPTSKGETISSPLPTQPLDTLQPAVATQSSKPNFHAFSEKELSIFMTRFYESLSPKQKQMFESERRNMTREQFRCFMIPILQRTHGTLPT